MSFILPFSDVTSGVLWAIASAAALFLASFSALKILFLIRSISLFGIVQYYINLFLIINLKIGIGSFFSDHIIKDIV